MLTHNGGAWQSTLQSANPDTTTRQPQPDAAPDSVPIAKEPSVPVYQYSCTACDEELEVRQSFTDASLTVCPACEGRLRKVLTAVGVVFKGSGFYRNDSRATPANGATSEGAQGESSKDAAAKDSGAPADASASESSGPSGAATSSDSAKKSSGETRPSNGSQKKSGAEKKPVAS